MTHTFHGGVHPNYMKRPDIPITVIAPPKQLVIPLIQHIGAPCKPLVQKGDLVKMGQKIGENPAPVSAPVHSPVSGKVIAVDKERGRVTVEGLHKVTRHEKPSMRNQNGGRIQVEAPVDISNVMLVHKGKPTRVGFKIENGKKYRYAKATGEIIDEVSSSKKR